MYEGTDPKSAMVVVPSSYSNKQNNEKSGQYCSFTTNDSTQEVHVLFLMKSISSKDCICSIPQVHVIMVLLFQYKCIING